MDLVSYYLKNKDTLTGLELYVGAEELANLKLDAQLHCQDDRNKKAV